MQHILENSQPQAFQCRSIVACARLFGNCHVATEGGIPRSSRWVVRFSPPRSSVSTDRQRFSAIPNFDFVSRVCTQRNALQASGRRSSSPSCRQRQLFFSDSGEISSAAEGPVARCRANSLSHRNPISKKILENQWLDRLCRFGCVLIVQHTTENHQSEGLRRSSFIACAEAFGNCDVATEGGIPRSSR